MSLNPHTIVTPRHQRLYETNATFHASVDTLAALLPLWLDGLAVHAEAVGDWQSEQVQMATRSFDYSVPPLPDDLRRGVHDVALHPQEQSDE